MSQEDQWESLLSPLGYIGGKLLHPRNLCALQLLRTLSPESLLTLSEQSVSCPYIGRHPRKVPLVACIAGEYRANSPRIFVK
jgi:hypothetical protein